MIQIWLTDKTQQECESIFLRYMVDCLPFYPFEIYGSASATEVAQYQVSEDRKREIEDGRIAIWGYEKLYRYLYLPRIDSKYPNQEEAKKIPVHQDRLRRLLLGPSGEMTVGKRREELNRIIKVIGKIEDHKQLSSIFQYDKFSKSKEAKYILNLLGMEVCPYCNRMFTVTRKQGTFSKKGIRPQFDHFFPKSLYPYLQVNLYNLIPSCGICNQYKGYHDTFVDPMVYPYDEGFGINYIFMSYSKNGIMPYQKGLIAQESFTLRLVPNLKQIYKTKPQSYKEWYALEKRILTSIEKLHLEDVYQAHVGFAADVLRNRYIFCDEYIEMLHRRFPQADFSVQDAKEMLYCHDIQPANWGKNILAKLAYDMDAEIE